MNKPQTPATKPFHSHQDPQTPLHQKQLLRTPTLTSSHLTSPHLTSSNAPAFQITHPLPRIPPSLLPHDFKYQARTAQCSPPTYHPNPHTPTPQASTYSSPPSKAYTSPRPPGATDPQSDTPPPSPSSPPAFPAARRNADPGPRRRVCV